MITKKAHDKILKLVSQGKITKLEELALIVIKHDYLITDFKNGVIIGKNI